MKTETPTPRTDAALIKRNWRIVAGEHESGYEHVEADFARQLERELTECRNNHAAFCLIMIKAFEQQSKSHEPQHTPNAIQAP